MGGISEVGEWRGLLMVEPARDRPPKAASRGMFARFGLEAGAGTGDVTLAGIRGC